MKKSTKLSLFGVGYILLCAVALLIYVHSGSMVHSYLLFSLGPFDVYLGGVFIAVAFIGYFVIQSLMLDALWLDNN